MQWKFISLEIFYKKNPKEIGVWEIENRKKKGYKLSGSFMDNMGNYEFVCESIQRCSFPVWIERLDSVWEIKSRAETSSLHLKLCLKKKKNMATLFSPLSLHSSLCLLLHLSFLALFVLHLPWSCMFSIWPSFCLRSSIVFVALEHRQKSVLLLLRHLT